MDAHTLSTTLSDVITLLDELVAVSDRKALSSFLTRMQARLFPGCPMLVAEKSDAGEIDAVINIDWPPRWVSLYLAERYADVDPVANAPAGMVLWSALLKPGPGNTRQHLRFISAARAHGMGRGLTWSVDFGRRRVFLSITSEAIESDTRVHAVLDALMPKLAVVINRVMSQPRLAGLTDQQCMILHCLASGCTDDQTAGTIGLATSTVTKKILEIKNLFGAKSRAQLMAVLSGVSFPAPEPRH